MVEPADRPAPIHRFTRLQDQLFDRVRDRRAFAAAAQPGTAGDCGALDGSELTPAPRRA